MPAAKVRAGTNLVSQEGLSKRIAEAPKRWSHIGISDQCVAQPIHAPVAEEEERGDAAGL
jgi:hypothetical protein